jgi:hypothetical protein
MIKKIMVTALSVLLLVLSVYCLKIYLKCELTDKEVKGVIQEFCTKMNIAFQKDNFLDNKYQSIRIGEGFTEVVVGHANERKYIAKINCKTKELVHFTRNGILQSYRNKYMINVGTVRQIKWPSFIEENKAKDLLVSLANHIGLPDGAELAEVSLDKNDGIWVAKWKKIYRGVAYENFCMAVAILAVDGEFYSFNKSIEREPSPTEVKIGRPEAISIAYKRFVSYFSNEEWEKNKDIFELKSAELNYAITDTVINQIIHNDRPRLVWVIVFDAKNNMGRNTIGVLIKDKSIIKVDPKTGKILSQSINIVR